MLDAIYAAAFEAGGYVCPIESGAIGRLVDNECEHGRLPGDSSAPCGCWWPMEVLRAPKPTVTKEDVLEMTGKPTRRRGRPKQTPKPTVTKADAEQLTSVRIRKEAEAEAERLEAEAKRVARELEDAQAIVEALR